MVRLKQVKGMQRVNNRVERGEEKRRVAARNLLNSLWKLCARSFRPEIGELTN